MAIPPTFWHLFFVNEQGVWLGLNSAAKLAALEGEVLIPDRSIVEQMMKAVYAMARTHIFSESVYHFAAYERFRVDLAEEDPARLRVDHYFSGRFTGGVPTTNDWQVPRAYPQNRLPLDAMDFNDRLGWGAGSYRAETGWPLHLRCFYRGVFLQHEERLPGPPTSAIPIFPVGPH